MRPWAGVAGRALTGTVLAAAILGTAGCSPGGSGHTTAADPPQCPGTVVHVAVSVSQWSDAVRTLGGACTSVTTVLDSAVLDPHDHELTTGDIGAFAGAQLVVLNGAGYDTWAENAAAHLSPRPQLVSAAAVAHVPAGHGDPHLWYDPAIVTAVSAAVTERLSDLAPASAAYFRQRAHAWQDELAPYLAEVARLRQVLAGRSYAATETVFDRTAAALGLRDATPAAYRTIISNEGEPGPGDVVAFQDALRSGGMSVLVYNTQTEGSLPEQLRSAARAAGVPVVAVTESPPEPDGSFAAWQLDQMHRLAGAFGVSS